MYKFFLELLQGHIKCIRFTCNSYKDIKCISFSWNCYKDTLNVYVLLATVTRAH